MSNKLTIISGGQTGVDRAALDAAIELNIAHGGWCPKNRKAEDGLINKNYLLQETDSEDPSERTKANIRHSNGTLIIVKTLPVTVTDGTILTMTEVKEKNVPNIIISLSKDWDGSISDIQKWATKNNIKILNVAGPRESQNKGIYEEAFKFCLKLFPVLTHSLEKEESVTSIRAKL